MRFLFLCQKIKCMLRCLHRASLYVHFQYGIRTAAKGSECKQGNAFLSLVISSGGSFANDAESEKGCMKHRAEKSARAAKCLEGYYMAVICIKEEVCIHSYLQFPQLSV